MLEGGKINSRQAIFLIIMTTVATAIIFLPSKIYSDATQNSWLSVLIVGSFALVLAYIISDLGLMFRDQTIIQYSETITGKLFGKVFGLLLCISFLHVDAIIIREFADLLVGAFYPDTPKIFFVIAIIFTSAYALFHGLEAIARVNEILFPIFFISIISIFLLSINDMNFENLTPFLADGIIPVLKGAYSQMTWYTEIVVLAVFIPFLNIPEKAKKISFLSMFFLILLGFTSMIGIITVFGEKTASLTFPFLSLGRYVSIADFIERLDSFILLIWVAGVFIKISVFHYCAVLSLSQLFNLRDYKPLIMPTGAILAVFSIILWSNTTQVTEELGSFLNVFYSSVHGGVPILLYLIAKLRRALGSI